MSLDSDVSLLNRIGIFSELPAAQIRMLAFGAVRHELPIGTVLFEKGALAKSGYVVTQGRIDLVDAVRGERKLLASCEVGTLIGEMALLVDTPRPATARAAIKSEVMEISRALMLRMVDEYPQVAVRMSAGIRERLRANVSELWQARQALFAEAQRPPLRAAAGATRY